jgi:ABC-2 type transport system permease protein
VSTRTPPTGARAFVSVAYGLAWRVVWKIIRNPSLLVPQLVFPLFFFTAFAGGLSNVQNLPGFDFPPGYTAFQFVFVLLQAAAFGGVFTGFGIASDFEYGFARRLFVAAPRRSALVAGYALAAVVRWAMTATLLTVVALIAGMHIVGDGVHIVALYALALIVNVTALLWACGVAMRIRSLQAGPIMQLPVFLILFFAPVYVPLALLEGWLHAVAEVNPVTRLLETGREFVAGEPANAAAAFGVALALALLFALWALRGLRRAEAAGP